MNLMITALAQTCSENIPPHFLRDNTQPVSKVLLLLGACSKLHEEPLQNPCNLTVCEEKMKGRGISPYFTSSL